MSETNVTSIPTENTSICQHCGVKVKADAQFCPYCGQSVIITPNKAFCEECGSELNDNGICEKCKETSISNDDESLANIAAYNQSVEGEKNKKSRKKLVWKVLLITLGSLLALSLFTYIYVLPMIYYHQAGSAFERQDYEKAYTLYRELDDYKNSESKIDDCIYKWVENILQNSDYASAANFKDTVNIDEYHYSTIYSKIISAIDNNNDFDYWVKINGFSVRGNAKTVLNLLEVLPSNYERTSQLTKLFKDISEGSIYPNGDYIRENKVFLKSVWDIGIVQNFLTSDDSISYFLEGYWNTYSGGYYLNFYENNDGNTTSSFSLPWVPEPYGTKFYDIRSQIYMWINSEHDELAKVFKFTIDGFDSMSVYCYRNNRTYKMYR